jgi:YggT family protein
MPQPNARGNLPKNWVNKETTMTGLNTAAIYVLQTLGSLYLLIVLLRFILQLVRADFYNPLSQFIVRATQPLLQPLRKVIPSIFGLDSASLLLAILVQLLVMALTLMLMGYGVGGFLAQLLVWSVIGVTSLFIKVFYFAMIASVILSWVAPGSYNPGAQLLNQICEPLLAPFRRILPNLGGLDISPIFAFIALNLVDMLVIGNLAAMTSLPCFHWEGDDLILDCHLQPKASKDEFAGLHGERLKIRLTAPPVEGKANAQLLAFLARAFGVAKSQVVLLSGELNRQKRVRIRSPLKLPELPGIELPRPGTRHA